jgi:hypothetical protein
MAAATRNATMRMDIIPIIVSPRVYIDGEGAQGDPASFYRFSIADRSTCRIARRTITVAQRSSHRLPVARSLAIMRAFGKKVAVSANATPGNPGTAKAENKNKFFKVFIKLAPFHRGSPGRWAAEVNLCCRTFGTCPSKSCPPVSPGSPNARPLADRRQRSGRNT